MFVFVLRIPWFFAALVFFNAPTLYLLPLILPSGFSYWLAPEGGAPAGVLLFLLSTWLQLMVLSFVGFYFVLIRRREPGKQDK